MDNMDKQRNDYIAQKMTEKGYSNIYFYYGMYIDYQNYTYRCYATDPDGRQEEVHGVYSVESDEVIIFKH